MPEPTPLRSADLNEKPLANSGKTSVRFPDLLLPLARQQVTKNRKELGDIACVSTEHDLPGLNINHLDKVAIERAGIKNIVDLSTIPGLSLELRQQITALMEQELRAAGKIQTGSKNISAEVIHTAYKVWLQADVAQLQADKYLQKLLEAGQTVPEDASALMISQLYLEWYEKSAQISKIAALAKQSLAQGASRQALLQLSGDKIDPLDSLPVQVKEAVNKIQERIDTVETHFKMSVLDPRRRSMLGGWGLQIYPDLTMDKAVEKIENDIRDPRKKIEIATMLAANGQARTACNRLYSYKPFTMITTSGMIIEAKQYNPTGFVTHDLARFDFVDAGILLFNQFATFVI